MDLLKISINKHALLCTRINTHYYIHINTYDNYYKKVYKETPKIFYHDTDKIIKKYIFFVHSINMPNISQINEIEYINKEINLLQDRLKINEKGLNQFQNLLM